MHADGFEQAEVCKRIALELGGIGEHDHVHLGIAEVQVPGEREAVAAVVAGAAEHGDREAMHVVVAIFNRFEHRAGRVFHEHKAGYAKRLDGIAVKRAHLIGREKGNHERKLEIPNSKLESEY